MECTQNHVWNPLGSLDMGIFVKHIFVWRSFWVMTMAQARSEVRGVRSLLFFNLVQSQALAMSPKKPRTWTSFDDIEEGRSRRSNPRAASLRSQPGQRDGGASSSSITRRASGFQYQGVAAAAEGIASTEPPAPMSVSPGMSSSADDTPMRDLRPEADESYS